MLRSFLSYLYREHRILRGDLAPLVVGRREYAQAKPPHFLHPQEVQRLLANLKTGTASEIRTYALVHLAYTMGLRHKEICQISLTISPLAENCSLCQTAKATIPLSCPLHGRLSLDL